MTTRTEAWSIGARRRELLSALISKGYGDVGIKALLTDEHPDLVPDGEYAAQRLQRELTKIRRAREAAGENTPEAEYIASLRRQLAACEKAMETNPNSTIIMRAGQLARDIAVAQGVAVPTRRPGGRKRNEWTPPPAASLASNAPTTPPATATKPDTGDPPWAKALAAYEVDPDEPDD